MGLPPTKGNENPGCPISRAFFAREVGIFDKANSTRTAETGLVYFANRRTLKEIGSPITTMCTSNPCSTS